MAGRPLKFQTVAELQEAIDAYFKSVDDVFYTDKDGNKVHEPLTITGLALALDTTRQTLMDYQERDEFTDAIKKAKTKIENFAEKKIFTSNPTGAIFALKNYGWKDKQEVDQRYVNKDGEDLVSEDLKILADYEKKIKSIKED